jgi:hypothetical protein
MLSAPFAHIPIDGFIDEFCAGPIAIFFEQKHAHGFSGVSTYIFCFLAVFFAGQKASKMETRATSCMNWLLMVC